MRRWFRYIIHESFLSGWLYPIIYHNWLRRFNNKEGFLSGPSLHEYLSPNDIFVFHAPEAVRFERPLFTKASGSLPKQIQFYVSKSFEVAAGEVYTFRDAHLMGENAVGLTHDGQIIMDTAMDLPDVLHKCNPRLLMNYDQVKTDRHFERAISLVHIFCNAHYVNYFHWINDSLLLLEGLEAYVENYNENVKIIINDHMAPFQLEYLNLLGYSSDQLIIWKDYKKVTVDELVVVKSRRTGTNMDEIVAPQALRWLNQRLETALQDDPSFPKRIFLTRQHTSSRRIINFDEILPILKQFDITVTNTDQMNVSEQIQLFSNLELIVAPHGAGLTNIIFSKNLKILELIGNVDTPNDFQWYCAYYSISQVMQHEYSFMIGDTIPLLKGSKTKQIYDLKIDPIELKNQLQRLTNEVGQ